MISREKSFRIPAHLAQTNSVGELLATLGAAKDFQAPLNAVIVTDLTYVRDGFKSVRKWSLNGWKLSSAHCELWEEVTQDSGT